MKKWMIGLLPLLVACNDETDIIAPVDTSGDAISFGIVPDWQATRANTSDMDLGSLQESGFGVFAYHNGTDSFFMNDTHVTFDGTEWTYSPEQRWPNSTVNFYAYAPYGGAGIEAGAAGSEATVRYTISDTAAPTDLLWGVRGEDGLPFTAVTKDNNGGEGIDFRFKHALARITLNIRASSSLSFTEVTTFQTTTLTTFFSDKYSSYIKSINNVEVAKTLLQDAETKLKDVAVGSRWNLGIILDRVEITSANIKEYWDNSYGLVTKTYVKDNIKEAMQENTKLKEFWVQEKVEEFQESHQETELCTTQKVLLTSITISGLYTAATLHLHNTTANTPTWSLPSGNATFSGFTIPSGAAYSTDNRDKITDPDIGITTEATHLPDAYLVIPSGQLKLAVGYRTVTHAPSIGGTLESPVISTATTASSERTFSTSLPSLDGSKEYAIGITIE